VGIVPQIWRDKHQATSICLEIGSRRSFETGRVTNTTVCFEIRIRGVGSDGN